MRLLIALLIAGAVMACGGSTEDGGSTAPTPEVTPQTITIEESAGIIPCEDGSQESCKLWQSVYEAVAKDYPDASTAWADCIAVYVSSTYTLTEYAAIGDYEAVAQDAMTVCGPP